MVKGITRLDPPRMLDPILTTLGSYYQTPEILPPLDPDADREGRPSDHLIPVIHPINEIDNRCSRTYREIKVRPITKSGMVRLREWFETQDWSQILSEDSINIKAESLMSMITDALNTFLPEKTIRVASDDEPWYSESLKKLDRRRRREYNRNRKSPKYLELSSLYKEKLSKTKKKYKRDMIDDLKYAKSGEWYSQLKRMTRYDQTKMEIVQVEEISSLDDQEQAERIADQLAQISQLYKGVERSDIVIPQFSTDDIPQLTVSKVKEYISRLKARKSTPIGDIPAKIIKEFAQYLCIPLTDIINSSLTQGQWADCYKKEIITPIPKEYPVLKIDMLRPISALWSFNKVQEMAICEMIASDMQAKLDPTQHGNRKRTGIQHYLLRLIHRILSETDNNSRGEIRAVLCTFIDWKQAYSRQSHILGVRSFLTNGVRPSLIPLLISYFQSREIRIKWHNKLSKSRKMPGSGAMGSSIGNMEFDSQTNNNADCVPQKNRFKFVDDLSILEIINLLNIGLASYNMKQQIPNDIPIHGQVIPSCNLRSQKYIEEINRWTQNQEMLISEKKTKSMIINYTDNYQFHTRLTLNSQNIQVVDKIKILGTIIESSLSWNDNCMAIIRKVNARMQLLRKVWSFGSSREEMVQLWKTFCLSVLDQSCVVWDSGLTCENRKDLERTQKTFVKLILEEDYETYKKALKLLHLETLEARRKTLSLTFIKRSLADGKLRDLFPLRKKNHMMETRKNEKYKVTHAHTERFKNSPIITLQKLLNENC